MSVGEVVLTVDEIAFRIAECAEPNAWLVVVADRPALASSLQAELEQLRLSEDSPSAVVSIASVGRLFKAVHDHPRGVLLLVGETQLSDGDWRRIDANRSSLMREGIATLILDEESAGRLENFAPNLASWVAGRVWRLADDTTAPALSPAEIEQRLAVLRVWSGREDVDVLRLAEAGQLPRDPEYAEWLTLLGRGDLLVA